MPNKKLIPLWIPIPGWPYHITSRGAMSVRSNVRIDERRRRVGGRVLAIQNNGAQVSLRRRNEAGWSEVRCRGVVGLRAEALEAWWAAAAEDEKARKKAAKAKVKPEH